MKNKCLVIAVSLLSLTLTISAQKPLTDAQTYADAGKKCDQAIDNENEKNAEVLCKTALDIANQLPAKNKTDKMKAYEKYAFTLFSQYKFQDALDNYTKAFDIGKTFLTASDADLAYAYLNLGRASQGLSKLDTAEENFIKAEKIYRAAYAKSEDSALKDKYKSETMELD